MPTRNKRNLSTDLIARHAALLSAVEIGLGSLLHGLRVPFGGHFLSLNQGFVLCRGLRGSGAYTLPVKVSNIVAVMKSLSPAGKRLTPMLAISAQGLCFSIGPALFGINLVGLSLGMILLSWWGFIQPVAILLLLFGSPLVDAVAKILPGNTPWIVAGALIITKTILAIGVAFLALRLPEASIVRYQQRMLRLGADRRRNRSSNFPERASIGQHAKFAAKELSHPLFLFSLCLTFVFFLWVDSPLSTVIWGMLRPIAGGFLMFFLFRLIPWEKLKFGATISRTVAHLREL